MPRRLASRLFKKPPAAVVTVLSDTGAASSRARGSSERVSVDGGRKRALERARRRIGMCGAVFGIVFAGMVVRLADISMFGEADLRAHAPRTAAVAPRPDIVDRNGVLLATDLPVTALAVDGRRVWDADETARKLAGVLDGLDVAELSGKLHAGRWVELRDNLTPSEENAVMQLGLPGVVFTPHTRRFYPQSRLAAHVIGHMEDGVGGVMGLEKTLDEHPPEGGAPLVASIDVRAQQILEEELSASVEKFSAEAGWGIVMDVRTGEVLALANLPDFDPNAPGASPPAARRNRAIYDNYELGSAFKAFTASAALESGTATLDSTFDARKPFRVADRVIHDFHAERRVLSFAEVLQYSSNIGAARMAEALGADEQKKYLGKFGMLTALDTALPARRAPALPARWGPVETATIAFGHGIAVTPLHLIAGYAAVVNGGVWRTPQFLKVEEPPEGRRAISNATSAKMRLVLRRVVAKGSGRNADVDGYYIIGKTATAEKPDVGGYDTNARISSFIGAFPGYDPHYVVMVSLDDPKPLPETYGFATAGWNAAPLAGAVIARLAPLYGVRPVDEITALARFYESLSDNGAEMSRQAAADDALSEATR